LLLSPEEARLARCDCGDQAKHILFTQSRGYSDPREGDVAAVPQAPRDGLFRGRDVSPARRDLVAFSHAHRRGVQIDRGFRQKRDQRIDLWLEASSGEDRADAFLSGSRPPDDDRPDPAGDRFPPPGPACQANLQ
jgi:hypothetical protein